MALYRDERIEWRGHDVIVTLHAVDTSNEHPDVWTLDRVIAPSYYDAAIRYTGIFFRDDGSETISRRRTVTRATKKLALDAGANIVVLGGPFEEIGNTNEAIGGENQKMG